MHTFGMLAMTDQCHYEHSEESVFYLPISLESIFKICYNINRNFLTERGIS